MSFRFLLRPKWLAWTTLVVVATAVMVYLSMWQWDRLDQRRERNDRFVERTQTEPVDVGVLLGGAEAVDEAELDFRRVSATGRYDPDGEVLIANRTFDGAPGWWVVTPMRLDDGDTVAINRGWVPFTVQPDGDWSSFAPPTGDVEVVGLLQATQPRMTGPLDDERTLPRLNLAVLGERLGTQLAPMWVQLESQRPAIDVEAPTPLSPPELNDGPHLNYAGQWLIFASLTVIIYSVLVWKVAGSTDSGRRKHEEGDDPDEAGRVPEAAGSGV